MWLTLIIAILTFLASPRDTKGQQRRALMNGLIAGGATWYATTQTDWGRDLMAQLDPAPTGSTSGYRVMPDGTVVYDGGTINAPGSGGSNGWDVLRDWGGTGTAAVIGATALATDSGLKKFIPWLLIGGAALIVLK